MQGLMMESPLTLTPLLERAARLFPKKEIASKLDIGGIHRYTYADFHKRVHRLAWVLKQLGVKRGDRVGSLCWNSYRHLELYFGVTCYGAVLHTLNLRLASDQLAYIINHADDRVIFLDASLLPILEQIRSGLTGVREYVVLNDTDQPEPEGGYEQRLAAASDFPYTWPQLEENAAAATCYTSGTTGHPKAVLYTHRSLVLHSYGLAMADTFAPERALHDPATCSDVSRERVGHPLCRHHGGIEDRPQRKASDSGSDRGPGRGGEAPHLQRGPATLWMGLYSFLENEKHDISSLRMIVCAGSALPRQFVESYESKYGIRFMLAWGMTETTPIATVVALKSHLEGLQDKSRYDFLARHGLPVAGVDIRIVDEYRQRTRLGRNDDGRTAGSRSVGDKRILQGSSGGEERGRQESFTDGWFRTGDVATIDPEGYIQIMDRTKDLVKSGGEWISSVDLEKCDHGSPQSDGSCGYCGSASKVGRAAGGGCRAIASI